MVNRETRKATDKTVATRQWVLFLDKKGFQHFNCVFNLKLASAGGAASGAGAAAGANNTSSAGAAASSAAAAAGANNTTASGNNAAAANANANGNPQTSTSWYKFKSFYLVNLQHHQLLTRRLSQRDSKTMAKVRWFRSEYPIFSYSPAPLPDVPEAGN